MYSPILVTPPSEAPVSVEEIKEQSLVDHDDQDGKIELLIAAAVSHLDGWTGTLGRALCEQTWRQDYDDFASCLRLPLGPVVSVEVVTYIDTDGIEQTVDEADYTLRTDSLGSYVEFGCEYSFPSLNSANAAVSVEFVAGYPVTDGAWTGPAAIKHAIMLLVAHWFENREAVLTGQSAAAVALPLGVDALLAPYRRIHI
jgi:uncharacterized phiE125 gp8 family phage protein